MHFWYVHLFVVTRLCERFEQMRCYNWIENYTEFLTFLIFYFSTFHSEQNIYKIGWYDQIRTIKLFLWSEQKYFQFQESHDFCIPNSVLYRTIQNIFLMNCKWPLLSIYVIANQNTYQHNFFVICCCCFFFCYYFHGTYGTYYTYLLTYIGFIYLFLYLSYLLFFCLIMWLENTK